MRILLVTLIVVTCLAQSPTGTVTFFDGEVAVGTGTLVCVGGSCTATFSTSALTPGTHSITAVYDGDGNFTGSTSPILMQVVVPLIPPPVLTFPALAMVNQPFSYQISASNSPTSFQATGLPTGLSLSAAGLISGSPTVAGSYSVLLGAANAGGTGEAILALTVTPVVTPPLPPVVSSFVANPTSISQGLSSVLTWSVSGQTSLTLNGATVSGTSTTVAPASTTTYTLVATNAGGATSAQATVVVTAPPPLAPPTISSFSASPASISPGGSTTLSWSVAGAASLTLNGSAVSGSSAAVAPSATTTYALVATNSGGSTSAQATVTVVAPPPAGAPNITSVFPSSVAVGQVVTLTGTNFPSSAILWITSSIGTQGLRVASATGTTVTFQPTAGIFPQGTSTMYLSGSAGNSNVVSLTVTN